MISNKSMHSLQNYNAWHSLQKYNANIISRDLSQLGTAPTDDVLRSLYFCQIKTDIICAK